MLVLCYFLPDTCFRSRFWVCDLDRQLLGVRILLKIYETCDLSLRIILWADNGIIQIRDRQSPALSPIPTLSMWFTRGFSLTNFVIGSSALSFQVFVLYPWHEQLDEEFKELRKEHARLLDETHKQHGLELSRIREELQKLRAERKGWWS